MQDMVGYEKLTKLLSDGDIGTLARISGAVEAGLQFIGRVHRETSLSNVSAEERERAVGQFRYVLSKEFELHPLHAWC